jgi:replicative DNA helicase
MPESKGWDADTFSFTIEFQKQIIASMIQEPKLFERIGLYVKPSNFGNSDYIAIYKGIQEFFNKYRGLPNKEACFELVKKNYSDINQTLHDSIDEIYDYKKLSVSTLEFIESNVKDFVSCQELKNAILESFDDLSDVSKHYNIKERIEKALHVCDSLEDLGTNVYSADEILERWSRRLQGVEVKRYSTGWAKFDEIFGGYGCGELFTYMGPAHSGKSMYLINAGANLLLQKLNVLHISLEMSEEITAQRYDMRLLGLSKDELKSNVANIKIKELLTKNIGNLVIKRYPSSSATASEIKAYIKRLENIKNFIPDVLIIDYADIMRSSKNYSDKRFELELIYQEIRNLAIEFKLPVITATQLNRSSLAKLDDGKILTEGDIAESYGIDRIIDCGVTINATPADNAKNQSLIYICKNRDGEAGENFRMFVDFKKALIREWSAPNTQLINKMTKKK